MAQNALEIQINPWLPKKKPTFHIAKSATTREERKLLWETKFPVKDGEKSGVA